MRNKLQKLCPSPEKIKDFFGKYGKKIDKKMQSCKVDAVKQAWESIKSLVSAQKSEEARIENDQQSGEGEGGGENAEQQEQTPEQNGQ